MSFGGGGFGSSNTGGGFGFGNNTSSTFGSNNTASSGTGLFGNTATAGGGFGSGGAFGSNNTSSPFGAKPSTGFGNTATTSSGGLFGGGTSTAGGFGNTGGFGSTNTASTTFGAGNTNTGGGLFGQNKTGFGANNTAGSSSLFGGANNTTTGGFGGNNTSQPQQGGLFGGGGTTSSGFGASNAPASGGFSGFGASNNAATTNNGTAGTPFQAFQEKDGTSTQTSSYQSITFQQPYQSKSFEELRTEDYLQGRRYGNSNGQAGSFGQTTGFGGGGNVFGNNNNTTSNTSGGGLFGASTTTSNANTSGFGGGFGANNTATNTTSGFGSNNGGGLFGAQQNKPAGGLFGNAASSSTNTGGFGSTAPSSGGLFGSNNNQQNTGFGASNTSNTGGGLFGNNQTQNKPAFGGFGQSAATNTTGFGNNTNTSGGLFGNNTSTNTTSGGGLFGANNQQQPQQNQGGGLFGSSTNTGGGLFGSNQNKPATGGLFGNTTTANTNTGGGLFGANNNQQQQNTGGGLFGSTANTNTGGGLFGNNNQQQNKPGGLFGSSTTNTNTGGGLFGSSTQQNNTGSSLFGGTTNNNANTGGSSLFGGGQQQNKPGGLFGSTASNTNTGGSLFGGNQNNQQGSSSLFGGSTQNQNSNSLFGSTNQTQQHPNQLHASLTLSPYGNDQLFSSLGQSAAPVGPLATPLAGARPAPSRTPSLLSSTRLNSPIYTPRASTLGRQATYGFSYSNFGTPNSSFSSSLTPQASSLLKPTNSLGSALTSRLAKSMSMQNLRGIDTPTREGGSLLRPTPGSASSRYLETGSMRKLKIDRSLRQDLFAPPEQRQDLSPPLHKKVSFDNSAAGAKQTSAVPNAANALVRTETEDDDASPAATRPQQRPNGTHVEMQQVNGASLTDIPEDGEPQRPASAPNTKRPAEKTAPIPTEVGEYWSKPALKDLKAMSRSQLQHLGQFEVGRRGIGKIQFSKADLSNTDLDQLYGGIVKLEKNSATVYPTEEDTPPQGQGLNVPSKIWLENSWPRSHTGQKVVLKEGTPAYEKHIRRFKRIAGTKFDRYEVDTGTWVFDVDHFTTYELDDDDDDELDDMQQDSSGLSEAPNTPGQPEDYSMRSMETSNDDGSDQGPVDDTFEFKTTSLRGSHIPGDFVNATNQHVTYDYDDPSADEHGEDEYTMTGGLGDAEDDFVHQGGAVQAPSADAFKRQNSSMALDDYRPDDIAEPLQDELKLEPEVPGSFIAEEPKPFRSILKPSTAAFSTFTSPEKLVNDTWEEQLQRTMSPKKRDRQALKNLQQSVMKGNQDDIQNSPFKRTMLGQSQLGQSYLAQKSAKKVGFGTSTFVNDQTALGKSQAFNTSMDIMKSLFADEQPGRRGRSAQGFENPYSKKHRLSASADLDESDAAFHSTMKPHFAETGTLVYAVPRATRQLSHPFKRHLRPLVESHQEIRFVSLEHEKFNNAFDSDDRISLVWMRDRTDYIGTRWGAQVGHGTTFKQLANTIDNDLEGKGAVWATASLLWDSVDVLDVDLVDGMDVDEINELRRDTFGEFWAKQVARDVELQLPTAHSDEEKALLLLTKNDVDGATELLLHARDFRLATLVAQLPGTDDSRALMQTQIEEWRRRNDWSEMSDAVRALYSLIAGQVCTVQGKNGPKEDRCSEFNIGEHFGLSWKQSLALRIFFGGHDKLDSAIQSYINDLSQGHERVQPVPAWANDNTPADSSEDIILGLLRIACSTHAQPADLEAILDPKAVSGSAMKSGLAWQLANILRVKKIATSMPHDKLDQLTSGFAAELEMTGELATAVWVLMHLTDVKTRELAIKQILMRNGDKISEWIPGRENEDLDDVEMKMNFRELVQDLSIDKDILWESKAQYARAALNNPSLQANYLINAKSWAQAQQVVTTSIGPKAVIEEDYEGLVAILIALDAGGATREVGSASSTVYRDFVKLVTMNTTWKRSAEGTAVMASLDDGLKTWKESPDSVLGVGHVETLETKVALREMERILRVELRENGYTQDALELENNMEGVQGYGDGKDLWLRYQRAMGTVA